MVNPAVAYTAPVVKSPSVFYSGQPIVYKSPVETKGETVAYTAQPTKYVYNTPVAASPYYAPGFYNAPSTVVVKAAEPTPKYVACLLYTSPSPRD